MANRVRLTTKRAAEFEAFATGKAANTDVSKIDVYSMNDARPVESKRDGNGSGDTFFKSVEIPAGEDHYGEKPISEEATRALNEGDVKGRDKDTNIPDLRSENHIRTAFQQSIKNARELDDRAAKCLIASERMLPGAATRTVEANAMDLMFLPTASIDSILTRQAALANDIVKAAEEVDPNLDPNLDPNKAKEAGLPPWLEGKVPSVDKDKKKEIEASALPGAENKCEPGKEMGTEACKEEKMETEASKTTLEEKVDKLAAAVEKMAGMFGQDPSKKPDADKTPGVTPALEAEANQNDPHAVDTGADPALRGNLPGKTASSHDSDVLDSIFSAVETGKKSGASNLSGMVRKASDSSDDLSALWGSTPDVSSVFS
jgi:hypothetical protein